MGVEAFSYLLPGGAIAKVGANLIKAGTIHTAKSAFRGTFIHGASKSVAARGVVAGIGTTGAGVTLLSTGADVASRAITRESLLDEQFIRSSRELLNGEFGFSLSVKQRFANEAVDGKVIIPLVKQDFAGISVSSKFGGEVSQAVLGPNSEVNTALVSGFNLSTGEFINKRVVSKDAITKQVGPFKFSSGAAGEGLNSVPTLSLGFEFRTNTTVSLDFKGIK